MINLFGIQIHIYGLLIGIAIWVSWEVAQAVAKRKKVPVEMIDSSVWWLIIGGIAGARIYHVIDLWQRYYIFQPIKVFYLWEGGLAIWGAIIGGVVGLFIHHAIYKQLYKKNRVNVLNIIDCVTVGLPLSQAIGRVGNWVNGELVGKNGEPLFAYEATLNVFLFVFLWQYSKNKNNTGLMTGLYLIGYGLIRIFLENFRSENNIWRVEGIPVAVMMGIVSVLIGLSLIFHKKWRSSASKSRKLK